MARYGMALGAVLLAAGGAGCAERGGEAVAPVQSEGAVVAAVNAIARAIALGMSRSPVRIAVRDAMRASPLTDHKLSFKDFAASSEGGPLIRAAASATGSSVEQLRARIAALPDLDFYVPSSAQRLTWQAGADYLVAVNIGGAGATSAYTADGTSRALDLWRSLPHETVLMLQSAETKSVRIVRQTSVAGSTIQDDNDGALSGSLLLRDKTGVSLTVGLADWQSRQGEIQRMTCLDDCGGGGGGGGGTPPPPPPQTYLENLNTFGVYDNGDPYETNEFEFRGMTANGTTEVLRIEGIPPNGYSYLHLHLIYAVPPMLVGGECSTTTYCGIAARETDGWPNPDDKWYFVYSNYPLSGTTCAAIPLGSNVENQEDKLRYFQLREDKCYNEPNLTVNFTWP